MKSILLKLILGVITGFGLQSILVIIQYVFRSGNQGRNMLIGLGFPYKFYCYTPDYTFQIFSRNHLIYDAFVSILFSFLIILIVSKMRRRRKDQSQPVNLMDESRISSDSDKI